MPFEHLHRHAWNVLDMVNGLHSNTHPSHKSLVDRIVPHLPSEQRKGMGFKAIPSGWCLVKPSLQVRSNLVQGCIQAKHRVSTHLVPQVRKTSSFSVVLIHGGSGHFKGWISQHVGRGLRDSRDGRMLATASVP
jgi:hypothetical protein